MYRLNINNNVMEIHGMYGVYEARDGGSGRFAVSLNRNAYVNEFDENGEEYFVEAGQEWCVPVTGLAELNDFIKKCEEDMLWNFINGPVFRMKPDVDNSILYVKGQTKSFVIGESGGSLYVDEVQNAKTHNKVENLSCITRKMIEEDEWWSRPAAETRDMVVNIRCITRITDGGNLRLDYRNKTFVIGQKDDGSFWVNVSGDGDRHIYYRDTWKGVLELLK